MTGKLLYRVGSITFSKLRVAQFILERKMAMRKSEKTGLDNNTNLISLVDGLFELKF
jgi:hypothetical protein